MNYQKHYDTLVDRAKNRTLSGYYESHHIVPRCLGGTDDAGNLCNLTPEEHYIAHLLLFKIAILSKIPTPVLAKLACAVNRMRSGNQAGRISHLTRNKSFGVARRIFSEFHPCKDLDVRKKIGDSVRECNSRKDAISLREFGCTSHKKVCYIRICPVCYSLRKVENGSAGTFCSTECKMTHLRASGYNDRLSKSAKSRISKLTADANEVRMLKSCRKPKTEEQRLLMIEKIKLTKKNRIDKIKTMPLEDFYAYLKTLPLFDKTGVKRNTNVCVLLKYRGMSTDDYYNSRIQEST